MYMFWLTLLQVEGATKLLINLIKRGYVVKQACDPLIMEREDVLGGVMTFYAINEGAPLHISDCLEEVKHAASVTKVKYHSIVVTGPEGSVWDVGNVTQSDITQAKREIN